MKKRLPSLLLCLAMALSLLTATAWAAPRRITSVSLTVSEPVSGSLPIYEATCGSDAYQVNAVNTGGFTNGVKWYDELAKRLMNSGSDTFVGGHNYTVTVWLEATQESGFVSPSATVNGNSAEVVLAGEDISVSYTFRYSYDAVAATADVPTAGKTPESFRPSVSTSDVSLYDYDWYEDSGAKMSKSYDTFQAGKTYTLKVRATSPGLVFTPYTTASINGETATVEEADGGSILFFRDFTAVLDEHELREIGVTLTAPEAGKSPSYSAAYVPATLTAVNRSMGANEYCENGIAWYDNNTHTYLKPTDIFQSGHSYQVSVGWLQPASGYKLAVNSYDEITAAAAVNGATASITGSASNFIVTYNFPELAAKQINILSAAIDAPNPGSAPDFTAEVAGEGIDASGVSVTWSDNAAGRTLSSFDRFEAGRKYTVTLSGLKPRAGYEFSGNILVTLNGEAAETESNQNKLIVGYTFAALDPNTAEIEAVALTLTEPAVGALASFTAAVPANANYTVKSVHWYCDEDDKSLQSGDTYGQKTYILNVTLTPKSGYSFANDTILKGTLNGNPAQTRRIDGGDALVTQYFSPAGTNPNPFTDVSESSYFYHAVLWAYYADPQVTNGIGSKRFGPDNSVTRGQAMTFLWRAYGCPEPETIASPFSDIQPGEYWYKPILWAAENGIANGTGNGQYSPNMTCSRAHIVTFLYRAAGQPNRTGAGNWYDDAVKWANGIGLLSGTAETFNPGAECPRKDMVLYLFRQLG